MIPYARQWVDDDDIAAVVAALKGDWLTTGPYVEEFESALASSVGVRNVVAFANGTVALHAAVVAAGLGPGDRVATSALTFVASANCARYAGAEVDLIDIEAATLNLDPRRVPSDIDALVAVHYAGLPFDLGRLTRRPRIIIEDAAHALGASTPDGPVGNCARSDACVFSFHPVKPITTGEGGAVSTNDPALADRLRRLRNHGIVRRPESGGWFYEVPELGFNYRLTDIQAALGSSQLRKLERFLLRREEIAAQYRERLARLPVQLAPAPGPGVRHAYHLFPVRVPERRRIYEGLRARGVAAQVHYVPVYRHPLYGHLGADRFPETERAYAGLLSLPMFPAMSDVDQDRVVAALEAELCPT